MSAGRRVLSGLRAGRSWFRAFRRTRPFWGGLWLTLAGLWTWHLSTGDLQVVIAAGFTGVGSWIVAGGMTLCGVLAIIAPSQRLTLGFFGTGLALSALVVSNFGGFLIGTALGIVGGTMLIAWGPRRPSRRQRRRAAAAATEPERRALIEATA